MHRTGGSLPGKGGYVPPAFSKPAISRYGFQRNMGPWVGSWGLVRVRIRGSRGTYRKSRLRKNEVGTLRRAERDGPFRSESWVQSFTRLPVLTSCRAAGIETEEVRQERAPHGSNLIGRSRGGLGKRRTASTAPVL